MSCSKIFQNFKNEILKTYSESFEYNNDESLFFCIGRSIPWSRDPLSETINYTNFFGASGATLSSSGVLGNDSVVPFVLDSDREKATFLRNNIYIKKINSSDFCFLIPRYDWEQRVYDAYRDYDELFDPRSIFYVYNKTTRGVYKCLDNNDGATSTQIPSVSDNSTPFITSDGYTWKLIYRVTVNDEIFSSIGGINGNSDYILARYVDYKPSSTEEIQQEQIQNNARSGSVEFVEINPDFRGRITYDKTKCVLGNSSCYVYESAATGATTVKINLCGNLSNHTTSDGFLTDFVFNVRSGSGIGQRRIITNSKLTSILDGGGITCNQYVTLTLQDPLNISLDSTSRFNIEPRIKVVGDGEAKSPTSANNSYLKSAELEPVFEKYRTSDLTETLNYVKIVDSGNNYSYMKAFFASGITNYYEDVKGASERQESVSEFDDQYLNFLNPILSPIYGHGSNALREFGSSDLAFKNTLLGAEENRLTPGNDFRQIALLKNPLLNSPVVQFRFDISRPSGITVGSAVVDGANMGKVLSVFDGFVGTGLTSFEVMVSDVSGNFDSTSTVSVGGNNLTVSTSGFSDGYRKYTIAGTENKNLLVLRVTNWDSGTKSRMMVFGTGNTTKKIYPSFASGLIRYYEQVAGSTYDIYLEDYKGRFKIGEKISIANTSTTTMTNMEISSFYYERENVRNSYSMTTKVYVSPQSNKDFNNLTFTEDQPIYSYDSNTYSQKQLSSKIIASGHLFKYTYVNSKSSILELTGARSSTFIKGHYIPYYYRGQLSFATINSVIDSDVNYNSGEVLYIQNFSPIQRNSSSREEINLVLGI